MLAVNGHVGLREVAQVLTQRREVIRQELRRIEDTLGFYEGPAPAPKAPPVEKAPVTRAKLPGPSAAVLAVVQATPGLLMRDVVNTAFANGVRSRAKDPKHMLRNTVDVLLRRKAIQKLDGKLYPPS